MPLRPKLAASVSQRIKDLLRCPARTVVKLLTTINRYIIYDLRMAGRLFLPNVRCGEEIHLRTLLSSILLLHSLYDLSVTYDLSRNIREFITLRPNRTRSDYKRDGFMNDQWLAVSNRRELA